MATARCHLCHKWHLTYDRAVKCCSRKCHWCDQWVDFDDYAHEFEDCSGWRDAHEENP